MHVIVSEVEVSIVSEFRAGDRRIAELGRNHLPAQMKSGNAKGVSGSNSLIRRSSRGPKAQQEPKHIGYARSKLCLLQLARLMRVTLKRVT